MESANSGDREGHQQQMEEILRLVRSSHQSLQNASESEGARHNLPATSGLGQNSLQSMNSSGGRSVQSPPQPYLNMISSAGSHVATPYSPASTGREMGFPTGILGRPSIGSVSGHSVSTGFTFSNGSSGHQNTFTRFSEPGLGIMGRPVLRSSDVPSVSSGFTFPNGSSGHPNNFNRFSSAGLGYQSFGYPGVSNNSPRMSSLMEMRTQFAPYSSSARSRNANTSRPPRPKPPVDLNIFCLGGPRDDIVPTTERRRELVMNNLGASMITIDRTAPGEVVAAAIRVQFPQLADFELLRAVGQGSGNPLARIQRDTPIPGCSVIISSRVNTIYVRPFVDIIDLMEDEERQESVPYSSSDSPLERSPAVEDTTSLEPEERLHGGFHFDMEGASATVRTENFVTLEEYRNDLYRRHSGEQIMVVQSRDNFVQEVLGMYKNPHFDYKKRTHVVFAGEPGRDVNGLSREFFSSGIEALRNGRTSNHSFFVGEMDYLGPSCYSSLLSDGIYRLIGKFMGHSAIHYGFGFVGMSQAILKFLFSKGFNDVSFVRTEDIPDEESRKIVRHILAMTEDGWAPNETVLDQIKKALNEAGIFETIIRANRHLIAQQYMLHCVIYNRFASLKELREGFMETGFFEMFSEREYLVEAAFPSTTKVEISAEEIMSRVTYRGVTNSGIKDRFETYVQSLDKTERKNLIQAWTGPMVIPPDGLQIEVIPTGRFFVRTCFSLMIIPMACDLEEMLTNLRVNGTRGFGEI